MMVALGVSWFVFGFLTGLFVAAAIREEVV